jgi:DNA-3-methyladenine glycosylase I
MSEQATNPRLAESVRRCEWGAVDDPEMRAYHDTEWGVPVHDDRRHFEFLILEGAQAGLSWSTILHKRVGYARAFDGFDPAKVARFTPGRVSEILQDPGIVRNRRKVESAVQNARAFLQVQKEHRTFDTYLWHFVGDRPKQNRRRLGEPPPATSPESDALSRDLRQRGFNFVGSTIVYAHMQSVGMVNDHARECFRYRDLAAPP